MNISIGCTRRFDITVTPELIALLTKLGNVHYDGVCKEAVRCGRNGFIYGWSNQMEIAKEKSFVDSLNNRELQTCLKICEVARISIECGIISQAEHELNSAFVKTGFAALRQAADDPRFSESTPVVVK